MSIPRALLPFLITPWAKKGSPQEYPLSEVFPAQRAGSRLARFASPQISAAWDKQDSVDMKGANCRGNSTFVRFFFAIVEIFCVRLVKSMLKISHMNNSGLISTVAKNL